MTTPTPKALLKALGTITRSAARLGRPTLDCVLFSGHDIVATDGVRILAVSYTDPVNEGPAPVKYTGDSIRYAANAAQARSVHAYDPAGVIVGGRHRLTLDPCDGAYPLYTAAMPGKDDALTTEPGRFDPALLGETLAMVGNIRKGLKGKDKRPWSEVRLYDQGQARVDTHVLHPEAGRISLCAVIMGVHE